MRPNISIIMPVRNGEKYIREAIGSIRAQTYKDYELIVVDDGCTDRTCELLDEFSRQMSLRCIHHSVNEGIARSVNDGLREAAGNFIAFLDHDDAWFPNFLEIQLAHLEAHPDVGMVHADFQTIDGEGNILEASVAASRRRSRPSGYVFPTLFLDPFIVGNSVLIRKECLDRVGGFDESLRWGDYHLWMRIARRYKIDYTNQVLTQYRQHAAQQTRDASLRPVKQDSAGLAAIRKIVETYPEIRQELGAKKIRRRMAALYFDMAFTWFSSGCVEYARESLAKAIGLWPTNLRYYGFYATCLLQPSHALALRNAWRRVRGEARI